MKFQKFVKAIGSDGIVYNRKNGEHWLASKRVFMKIPEDIHSVTCADIADMPEFAENISTTTVSPIPVNFMRLSCPTPMALLRTVCGFTLPKENRTRLLLTTVLTLSLNGKTSWKCS